MKGVSIIFFLLLSHLAWAQASIGFEVPATVCLDQTFTVGNDLQSATSAEWDFCEGDLLSVSLSVTTKDIAGVLPIGPDLIQVGDQWYGFICARADNKLFRLDFGSDLTNQDPVVTDLGNIDGKLAGPQNVKAVQFEQNFYLFIDNLGVNGLVRIDLGSDITSATGTATVLEVDNGFGNSGLDVAYDGTNWVVAVTTGSRLHLYSLGNSPANDPQNNMLTSEIPDAIYAGDIDFVFDDGSWYGFVSAYGSATIHRLFFGSSLYLDPSDSQTLTTTMTGVIPFGLDIERDNGRWILFTCTAEGPLYRLDMGADIENNSPSATNLGNFDAFRNTYKITIARSNSRWVGLTTRWDTGTYFLFSFAEPSCPFNQKFSHREDTVRLTSLLAGSHAITRITKDVSAISDVQTATITVTEAIGPTGQILFEGCTDVSSVLSFQTDSDVTDLSWDLDGDGVYESQDVEPHVEFSSAGEKPIALLATASNGCTNDLQEAIKVFDAPVAAFTGPDDPICTNAELLFVNETTDNFEGLLTYTWSVNGAVVSEARDLNYTFLTEIDYDVTLNTSIPGCFSTATLPVENVRTGPIADFNIIGKCEDEVIQFQNISTGDIDSFAWILPDGSSSSDESIAQELDPGEYEVTLTAVGTTGCETVKQKPFSVHETPKSDFEIFPARLCSEKEIQFEEAATVPAGESIASWIWTIDGTDVLEGETQSYVYSEHGEHSVQLEVITASGCNDTEEKVIDVERSPSTAFQFSTACVSVAGTFTPEETDASSWLWTVDEKVYQVQQPSHTFRTSGQHSVTLRVVAKNGCDASSSQKLSINPVLTPQFLAEKNCVGEETLFHDVTVSNDPISLHEWTFSNSVKKEGEYASYSWSSTGDKAVGLTVTTVGGCIYSSGNTINIVEAVKADFIASPETGSPPALITFINTSGNADSFGWNFGDEGTSEESNPTHTYSGTGTYTVTLSAANNKGCADSKQKTVVISPSAPDAAIIGIAYADNPDGTLKITVSIGNNGNTVMKDFPVNVDISDGIVLTEKVSQEVLPDARFNFVLPYSLHRSTDLTFLCATVDLPGDISTSDNRSCIEFDETLLFLPGYPNPATELVTVEWMGQTEETIQITLLNSMGMMAAQFNVSSVDGFNRRTIDVRGLGRGVYMLILESANQKTTQHIVLGD
jgi:PKD repeat protein